VNSCDLVALVSGQAD